MFTPRRSRKWLAFVLGALVVGTLRDHGPLTAQDRVTAISRTIKCPTCQGESVAESNAGPSKEIRRDIAERVQQGQTDDQIRQAYADNYGDYILLTKGVPIEATAILAREFPERLRPEMDRQVSGRQCRRQSCDGGCR